MFHVGQLVVCVDDYQNFPQSPIRYLSKGKVYEVIEINVEDFEPRVGVRVGGIEWGNWYADSGRFRPVVETRLDVFREMLAPVPGVKQKECV